MIRLRKLDGKEFVLNSDLIRQIEAIPDTLLTLTGGEKLLVAESVDEVREAVIRFRRSLSEPAGA